MAFRQLLGATVKSIPLHNAWYRCIQRRCLNIVTGTEGCSTPSSTGLVLGVYSDERDDSENIMLTSTGSAFDQVNEPCNVFVLQHSTLLLSDLHKWPHNGSTACRRTYAKTR